MTTPQSAARRLIDAGDTALGIELGSTRIKAVLVGPGGQVLASGGHGWENAQAGGYWTYSYDAVVEGLQAAYRSLADAVSRDHGTDLVTAGALGISAMMHGYLPLDASWQPIAPFRTWRNTTTAAASAALTDAFDQHMPQRWSISHLYQAVLDAEEHLDRLAHLTTLSGYVHHLLTGENVLGVGDAVGMFPLDAGTNDWDEERLRAFDRLLDGRGQPWALRDVLPRPLVAGSPAGTLTPEGAALLDPSGRLRPGVPCCPPEGDAGTGMVATAAIAPRTGNVSAGTSVFAMVVLERPIVGVHGEIDLVTTPAGDPVAMVHVNNCSGELSQWMALLGEAAALLGSAVEPDELYARLFAAADEADGDAGGLLAYNYQSGEHTVGLEEGRPLLVRTPGSSLTVGNLVRAQLNTAFATLALGMSTLTDLGVRIDELRAHGGIFRTRGVAQRILAAALGVPVAVGATAGEGGAWGMALLADFLRSGSGRDLAAFLADVFAGDEAVTVTAEPGQRAAYERYLDRFRAGLAVERAAVQQLPAQPEPGRTEGDAS